MFDKTKSLTLSDALYLATRGGAEVLDMQGELGALQPGMQADLLRVNMANQVYNFYCFVLLTQKSINFKFYTLLYVPLIYFTQLNIS